MVFFFLYFCNIQRGVIRKTDTYIDFDEYVHKFTQDSNFKNLNFLLGLLYSKYSTGFKVICVEVDKKYRKKLQTRYVMKLVYLSPAARKKHFFRVFNSFALNVRVAGARERIFDVLCGGILSGNKSLFYDYKKTVFRYLLKRK